MTWPDVYWLLVGGLVGWVLLWPILDRARKRWLREDNELRRRNFVTCQCREVRLIGGPLCGRCGGGLRG